MKIFAPDYYTQFKCTAGLCKHSCCIGWEIDIDEDTHDLYSSIEGDFGKRLSENILVEGDTPFFKLSEKERCPFLNKDNLCDIILELGEGALCQICSDHPRFRNFYDDRIEIGLGLCCEVAAKLILERKEKMQLIEIEADTEEPEIPDNSFFDFRSSIFDVLQERSQSIDDRINAVLCKHNITFSSCDLFKWSDFYKKLERLEPSWSEKLCFLNDADIRKSPISDTTLEQLLVYFIYRHLADGMYDGRLKERIAFAILSTNIIRAICSVCGDDVCEIARMYSSEIEYSEENVEAILNAISEEI